MACFKPVHAHRLPDGRVVMVGSGKIFSLELPCGQCTGCRLRRSAVWAMRCVHESSLYPSNCFITLTYSPEFLPSDNGLHYEHFQNFIKRLRARKEFKGVTVRYFMAGEYGDKRGRPHFHAILFNVDFPDRKLYRLTHAGHHLDTSVLLSSIWPYGFASIGSVSFESAAYVARYCVQLKTGKKYENFYKWVDTETGEVHNRVPPFCRMSKYPPIGHGWLDKFYSDVYPRDGVLMSGVMVKPGRAYDKIYAKHFPEIFEAVKAKRILDIRANSRDNTYRRLQVKEAVALAKVSILKRGFY